MDRRAFLMTSAWLTTGAGCVWPWLAHAAACGETIAMADSTLPASAAFARYAAAMKLPTFETGDDIGLLWHTRLLPLLHASADASTVPWLIGLTRPSDYFVLKQLATRTTHRLEHGHGSHDSHGSCEQAAQCVPVSFAFAPRQNL